MKRQFGRLLRSGSARLVMIVFAVQLALAGITMGIVFISTGQELDRRERATVEELRDDLLAAWRVGGAPNLKAVIADRLASGSGDIAIVLVRADGNAIAGNLGGWPAGVGLRAGWARAAIYRPGTQEIPYLLLGTDLDDGQRLLVSKTADGRARLAGIVAEAMLTALVLAVPLAAMLAVLLGRFASQRLRAIASTAAAVTAGDLKSRVPRDDSHDAFDDLAGGVNVMLERIDGLVDELRIVTDGLAHDLRSPLTRLKSTLEAARRDVCDPAALAALDEVAGEADRLLAMLATALQISRAEAGIGRDHFVATDFDALIDDLVEVYGPVAEDRGIELLDADSRVGTVTIHRQLVQQALANLLDNALTYADGATRIGLAARRVGSMVELEVADNGVGIPPHRVEEARRRFGRLDPARHAGGTGLGLALVESVARLHQGTLRLEDNAPGLRAVLVLSAQTSSSAPVST